MPTFSSELPDGAQELKQLKSSSFGMPLFQVLLPLSSHHKMSVKSVIFQISTYWCIIPKETIFVSNLKHQECRWIFAFQFKNLSTKSVLVWIVSRGVSVIPEVLMGCMVHHWDLSPLSFYVCRGELVSAWLSLYIAGAWRTNRGEAQDAWG